MAIGKEQPHSDGDVEGELGWLVGGGWSGGQAATTQMLCGETCAIHLVSNGEGIGANLEMHSCIQASIHAMGPGMSSQQQIGQNPDAPTPG